MPILRFTSSADTTITNAFKPFSLDRALFSNMGAADSLEVFSISSSIGESEKSRVLVKFPIEKISSLRAAGTIPTSGNVNFYFNLYNVKHPETLPRNYYMVVKPVSGSESWDEGFGLDIENHTDLGRSGSIGFGTNWIYRNSTSSWDSAGGDYLSEYAKSFYFDNGTENISIDITDIIEAQLTGVIPNSGLGVMLSGAYETAAANQSYYTKRFSARSSEYFYNRPLIEARWKSVVNDDRGDFYYESNNLSVQDNLQNIYFYNRFNGSLKDLPNSVVPFVKILDEDKNLLTSSIQSAKVSTGIYSASFSITGTVEQTLSDIWYSGSNTYFTSQIEAKNRVFDDTKAEEEYVLAVTNLKSVYKSIENPDIRVFCRKKNWSPNIYSISYKIIETLTLKNLYFKVFRLADNFTVVDYGIDPIQYTLCSYDKNGNYFNLDMSMLEPGYSYGIKLMTLNGNTKVEYNQVFRFKVE